ncbi:MAG: Aminomethyltransferase (glycine cleavage system T protein), partial [uncultured Frankineae bacterium]
DDIAAGRRTPAGTAARPPRGPGRQARRLRRLADADRVPRRRRSQGAPGGPRGGRRLRRQPPGQGRRTGGRRRRLRQRPAHQRPAQGRGRSGAVHPVLRRGQRRRRRRPHRVRPQRGRGLPRPERRQQQPGGRPAAGRRAGGHRGPGPAQDARGARGAGAAQPRARGRARAADRPRLHVLRRCAVAGPLGGRLPHRLHGGAGLRAAAAVGGRRCRLGRAGRARPGARRSPLRARRPRHPAHRDGLPAARAGPLARDHAGAGPGHVGRRLGQAALLGTGGAAAGEGAGRPAAAVGPGVARPRHPALAHGGAARRRADRRGHERHLLADPPGRHRAGSARPVGGRGRRGDGGRPGTQLADAGRPSALRPLPGAL